MLLGTIGTLLALALATASVTLTLTRASIFRPWRYWIARKSKWLGKLFSCPYCMSHWVALVFVLLSQQFYWFEDIIAVFIVVTIAAPFQWLTFTSIQGLGSGDDEQVEMEDGDYD